MPTTRLPWIRTYPHLAQLVPRLAARRFVWDDLTPWVTMDKDYRPVLAGLDASTVIVEWDIAFGADDAERFERYCLEDPNTVHVAPYLLYPASTGLAEPVWAHRRANGYQSHRWVIPEDLECDLFAFGMVYLPISIVTKYLLANSGMATDATFSLWHDYNGYGSVPIHWDVRVIHLHY